MDNLHNVGGERLKSFIERIERLEDEKDDIALSIKDVYLEAKAAGFEPKIIKKLIRLKATTEQARREEAELLALYASAVQLDLF